MSTPSGAAPQRQPGSRGRLRALLSPDSNLRSSTWDAPPASFTAVETEDAVPDRVTTKPGDAWLVRDFDLAERMIAKGADSSRVAVAHDFEPQAWIDALVEAGPSDPLLPPSPYDFGRRMLVVLPTYNEADNLEDMVAAIRHYLKTDILVVDDGSPDGTGQIADRIAAESSDLSVLHRAKKEGLGPAYIAGFREALARGYERVFEMDCDFSHAPWDVPRLAAAAENADLVIGSRYVRGGNTEGWKLPRRVLSRSANLYTKLCLGFRVKDWTAGFRCFQADRLRAIDLDSMSASGYSFQIEMAWRVLKGGGTIRELPVHFVDRNVGASKMSKKIAFEAIRVVPTLRFKVRR